MTAAWRQRDLFTRRWSTKRPPSAREFATHCALADTIRLRINPGWIWTHFPAGEKRTAATGARLKRLGLTRGWPDLLFLNQKGSVCFLELKRKGERLTLDQEVVGHFLRSAGHGYCCADSYETAVQQLVAWGVLHGVHPQ